MRVKNVCFAVITLLLVGIIMFCVSGTVRGQEQAAERELENWYRAKEVELLRDTRTYLDGNGYRNSGVTLTRVVDEEGGREYVFTIHHAKIDRMGEEQRSELREKLTVLCLQENSSFPENTCSFRHEFLFSETIGN